ncbi:MAG: hypothetical protein M0Z82_00450 [Actinomycetota bacterium]|nr:hypothetical protein [Actinomycetota bacterium]
MDHGDVDDVLMAAVSARFADRAATVLPGWMAERAVAVLQSAGLPAAAVAAAADEVHRRGSAAGGRAAGALRQLVDTDVDLQRSTPLAVVRASVGGLSELLHRIGVEPPARPEALVRAAPEDSFGLAPSSWSEVDADLADAALTWGAAKAAVHLRRHRPRGGNEDAPEKIGAADRSDEAGGSDDGGRSSRGGGAGGSRSGGRSSRGGGAGGSDDGEADGDGGHDAG